MQPHEIQARATIAAALIQSAGPFDMTMVHAFATDPSRHIQLGNLKTAVETIYRALVNP